MELLSFVVIGVGFVFAAFVIVHKDSQETAAIVRANAAVRRAASSRHAQPARHKDFLDVEGLSWPLTEEHRPSPPPEQSRPAFVPPSGGRR